MRIRVLWLIKGLGPGGAEVLLAAAAEAHDHEAFDIECAFVLPSKDHLAERLERAGVRCHCLSTKDRDRLWPLGLRRLMTERPFDVVHAHSPLPAVAGRLASRTLPRTTRPALVTTEHNAWGTFDSRTRWANRLTVGFDDAVFAVSEETRTSMSTRLSRRATTLRHGIDVAGTASQATHRDAVRAELGIGADEFVVGTVANYREQKDYPNLLRAAALLQARRVPIRVVAVGQGQLEDDITALRDELGLGERVLLTGWRPDAARVMAAFDVFTLASRWEGLPVALMEALALGLPVVATRVGGVGEELADTEAILVPLGRPDALADAWTRLSESPEDAQRLADASNMLARDFDVANAVAAYEATYRSLTSRSNAKTAAGPVLAGSLRGIRKTGLDIRPASPSDRPQIIDLLSRTLGWENDPRYAALFSWKHDENPFGPSPMWVACDGERVVGLRVFMRWRFRRGGEVLSAVRAVDTATAPDFQGRGLFTELTMHGLEALREDGVDFVFNTPNSQSLPGYLKMGWRQVGRLHTSFSPRSVRSLLTTARARVPADLWSKQLEIGVPAHSLLDSADVTAVSPANDRHLSTDRSEEFLRWRYGTPLLHYRAVRSGSGAVILRGRGRGPARELVVSDHIAIARADADSLARSTLREVRFDHVLRCGGANLRTGFAPLPGGGPVLTWRPLKMEAMPPRASWNLTMGDVELF